MIQKITLCIVLMWLTVTSSVMGVTFPGSREVIVLTTAQQNASIPMSRYVYERTIEPFKYPHYELRTYQGHISIQEPQDMRRIAYESDVDIVLLPVIVDFSQWRYNPSFWWNWDGDERVYTNYLLRMYAYDRQADTLCTYEVHYSNVQLDSIDTTPEAMLKKGMNDLMKKLPYKRIPSKKEGVCK